MVQYAGGDSFPASAETVNDGTGRDAASVNVGIETALDRTTYLQNIGFRRTGQWAFDDDTFSGGVPVWVFNSTTFAANTTSSSDWVVDVVNVRVGDIISIDAAFFIVAPINTDCFVRLGVTHNALGGERQQLAPGFRLLSGEAGGVVGRPFSLSTHVVATQAGTSRVRLLGRAKGAGHIFSIQGYGEIRATLFRPSGSAA